MNEEKVVDATLNEVVAQKVETDDVKSVQGEVATPEQKKVDAVQTKEENANYAKIRREAEEKANQKQAIKETDRIKRMAKVFNWDKVETSEQLDKALEELEIQQESEEKGITPEMAKEMKNIKDENAKFKAQNKRTEAWQEFFKEFPTVKYEDIPKEVLDKYNKGGSLNNAYVKFKYNEANEKLAEYAKTKQADDTNTSNQKASTGSVADKGNTSEGAITQETFDANRSDKQWVKKNFKSIIKGQSKGLITH